MNRRSVLRNLSAFAAISALPQFVKSDELPPRMQNAIDDLKPAVRTRKIATEEAFTIPEIVEAIRKLVKRGGTNLDLLLLEQLYEVPDAAPAQTRTENTDVSNRDKAAKDMLPRLLDLEKI